MALAQLRTTPETASDPESARLAALDQLDILDTPPEQAFERVADLVKLVFGVETSLVTMIDGHRQWYKAARGSSICEVPVADTFCRFTIAGDGPLVVPDATKDERFRDNPSVTGAPHVRFYAGIPIRSPDGFKIGTVCAIDSRPREFSARDQLILSELGRIVTNELELRQLASTDGLTGISSRRSFKDDAAKFVALARRHRTRLSSITFDIDHFKRINDTYGHGAGDKVLEQVARTCRGLLRESDLFGRIGGEEFAALLPDADAARAREAAEKLRTALRDLEFPGSRPPIAVTASFGVAAFDPDGDDIAKLLAKADEALYEAKRSGRNRTVVWHGETANKMIERRRVLKAGKIILNNRQSTISCTVRALWDSGAELMVSTTVGIPDAFALSIMSDGLERICKVTDRRPQWLEVEFA